MTDDEPTIEQLKDWLSADGEGRHDDSAMSLDQMHELADRIVARESSTSSSRSSASRSLRRRLIVVAAPVAIGVLAAAGWALTRTDAHNALSLACVTDDVTAVIPADGTPPVDACAELWTAGAMEPSTLVAPALVACVDDSGSVSVVEGTSETTCHQRGLAAWGDQPEYEAAGSAITAVRIELHQRYRQTGNGCATAPDWRNRLARHPTVSEWTITIEESAVDGPCLDVATADPTTQTITLTAIPGAHSIGCDPRTGC